MSSFRLSLALLTVVLAFGAAACRFEVSGLDDSRTDAAVDPAAMPAVDLAGAGLDLAPRPDLGDPCAPAPAPIGSGVIASCAIGNPPTVDGRIEEWVTTPRYVLRSGATDAVEGGFSGRQGDRDRNLSGAFQVRWDEAAVYVAVTVVDDQRAIAGTNTSLWQGDSVEIYLSATGAGQYGMNDMQLLLAPNATGMYYRGDGVARPLPMGVVVAARDVGNASGYELEVSIPWSLLGTTGRLGRLVRFDVQLNDADVAATRERFLTWRIRPTQTCAECVLTTCQPYCSTATFDSLQLGGR
jgi:hypothetical protein